MVNRLLSSMGILLDNFVRKPLIIQGTIRRMVGPGGLEPPTRPLRAGGSDDWASDPIARGARRQRRAILPRTAPDAQMALKGATYMQSALEGSWLIPNKLLKSPNYFLSRV